MPKPIEFRLESARALQNPALQQALGKVKSGFIEKRRAALQALPQFEAMREAAEQIKNHALDHLDFYLRQFEAKVVENGGQVHWAETPQQAREIIAGLCQLAGAKRIAKGKTMTGEEIDLNAALEQAGLEPVETDLGEYILQLAGERPSHIIAPAIHKTRAQIAELFSAKHGMARQEDGIADLVDEARQVLREKFLSADAGITGANFLVAETGSVVLVTNEGNGDLSASLPPLHIVVAGIEKVVPTLQDTALLLRLLGRSATGQAMTAYTSFFSGPRPADENKGAAEFHVVLLDNGRSRTLATPFRAMLRCIRCGACLNHCPVYGAVGGHAYGSIYSGPMGSVLTPLLQGLPLAGALPEASSLCGRCGEVCPVKIPLPDLLRRHRADAAQAGLQSPRLRWGIQAWAWLARKPRLYRLLTGWGAWLLRWRARRRGSLRSLPLVGNWTDTRDLPAPQGETFMNLWRREQRP
jgi:L-lactate dehydrogenase complex protein LldF